MPYNHQGPTNRNSYTLSKEPLVCIAISLENIFASNPNIFWVNFCSQPNTRLKKDGSVLIAVIESSLSQYSLEIKSEIDSISVLPGVYWLKVLIASHDERILWILRLCHQGQG